VGNLAKGTLIAGEEEDKGEGYGNITRMVKGIESPSEKGVDWKSWQEITY
jgi:hypothetical protein